MPLSGSKAPRTSSFADYAVCEGPQPYYWGGTWICGAAGSDNLDTIKNRLSVYHSQTSPLREYYISEGKYHGIDGAGDVDEIFSRIKESLHSRVPGLDGDSSK